jgi:DNA-binding NarL/FixJ family response regulator
MDDSPVVLEAARAALAVAGFSVQTAATLAELERQLAKGSPDLLVLDVEMPEMFGDHIGAVLRQMRGLKMPIYLWSDRSAAELACRAAESQLDGYISKDDGPEGVVRKARKVLEASDASPFSLTMSAKRRHRVLIVDDSHLARVVTREVLEADGDIEVVAEAADAYQALGCVEVLEPDVVTLDASMPGVDGLQALAWIRARCGVPVVVMADEHGSDPRGRAEAARLGAVEVVTKAFTSIDRFGVALRETVRKAAVTPVTVRESAPAPVDTQPPTDSARDVVQQFIDSERARPASSITRRPPSAGMRSAPVAVERESRMRAGSEVA